MLRLFRFYQLQDTPSSFSTYIKLDAVEAVGFEVAFNTVSKGQENIVQIIAFCIMPTHIHLILKQLKDSGIATFMGNVLNSYSRYFNLNHNRKGPLWESKFKNVLINNDDQLLHLTRYIHLNPVTAFLCENPKEWSYSSYKEYIDDNNQNNLCQFSDLIKVTPIEYEKFVNTRKNYQRELKRIEKLLLEN